MSALATQTQRSSTITDPIGAAGLGTVLGVWAHPDDEDEHIDLHRRLPVFGPGLPVRTSPHELALIVEVRGSFLDTEQKALSARASRTRIVQEAFGRAAFRDWWRNETFVDAAAVTP